MNPTTKDAFNQLTTQFPNLCEQVQEIQEKEFAEAKKRALAQSIDLVKSHLASHHALSIQVDKAAIAKALMQDWAELA